MTEGICRVNCFVRLPKPRYHRGMTRSCLLLFTLALSVLSACAPPPLWYRSGISPTRLSQDLTACRVAALKTVPTEIRSRYIPAEYISQPVCTPSGHCYWRRVLVRPAQYERYDVNAPLREDVVQACMADKGYTQVRLPACQSEGGQKITVNTAAPLPPLTDQSCAVRLKSGEWRIVTPSGD